MKKLLVVLSLCAVSTAFGVRNNEMVEQVGVTVEDAIQKAANAAKAVHEGNMALVEKAVAHGKKSANLLQQVNEGLLGLKASNDEIKNHIGGITSDGF